MSNRRSSPADIDSLRASLLYDIERVSSEEHDPFRRLAWLIGQQERWLQQRGESRLSEVGALLSVPTQLQYPKDDLQETLRDYYELRCALDFPRRLIRKGLSHDFRSRFIQVLGEVEKDDPDFGAAWSDKKVIEEIENWLGFRRRKLATERPGTGLTAALADLKLNCSNLSDSKTDCVGVVCSAFTQAEGLLKQLIAFYGRVFWGPDYKESILQEYRGNNSRSIQRENLRKDRLCLWDLAQILHDLDQWISDACQSLRTNEEQERGQRFERFFPSKRVFSNLVRQDDTIQVPIKEGNQITTGPAPIKVPGRSQTIELLEKLNELRPYFDHHKDPKFLHPSNLDNVREGARQILNTFVGLWADMKDSIFPRVICVRRILQVEPGVMRLDYVPEKGPLERIRVELKCLPLYTPRLLGQEVYLYARREEGSICSDVILLPVDEELVGGEQL